jgi:hypothetical protein
MHPLRAQFDELAHGRFPPPDGQIAVLSAPDDITGALIGLTGHLLVAAAVDPAACVARFGPGDEGYRPIGSEVLFVANAQ